MTSLLLISDNELSSELELAKGEIIKQGFSVSGFVKFEKALFILKNTAFDIVLINAKDNKLKAYELVGDLYESFRSSLQVIVFLPNSSSFEGSKFGKYHADVEDEKSIVNITDRLKHQKSKQPIIEENIFSLLSISGGLGTSFISILLANIFSWHQRSSMLIESNSKFSSRDILEINPKHALLSRDRSKEVNQVKDLEWFSSFLSQPKSVSKLFYLNLFHSFIDRQEFLESSNIELRKLVDKYEAFFNRLDDKSDIKNLKLDLLDSNNKLKLVLNSLEASSYNIFEEIIQLGSKFCQNIIVDLSNDFSSNLNKQFLAYSKYIVLVFSDSVNIKASFDQYRCYLSNNFNSQIIPVLACDEFNYSKYKKLKDEDWLDLLGLVPVLYPKDISTYIDFAYDSKQLKPNSKLFKFSQELYNKFNERDLANQKFSNTSGVLKLLNV